MSCLFLAACRNTSPLQRALTDLAKSEFWKILKWNAEDYSKDNLFLKIYTTKEYEWFRVNKKKNMLVSLKPDSSSDISPYEFWEIKNDSILIFKKRQNFKLTFLAKDSIAFVNEDNPKDSLIISKFYIDLTKLNTHQAKIKS